MANNDYRKMYKEYFNIKFSSKYVIHHIDLNHDNNDIKNLVLLPRDLHSRYHHILSRFAAYGKVKDHPSLIILDGSVRSIFNLDLDYSMITELFEVLVECSKWIDYKSYLMGRMPNVHNIELR